MLNNEVYLLHLSNFIIDTYDNDIHDFLGIKHDYSVNYDRCYSKRMKRGLTLEHKKYLSEKCRQKLITMRLTDDIANILLNRYRDNNIQIHNKPNLVLGRKKYHSRNTKVEDREGKDEIDEIEGHISSVPKYKIFSVENKRYNLDIFRDDVIII